MSIESVKIATNIKQTQASFAKKTPKVTNSVSFKGNLLEKSLNSIAGNNLYLLIKNDLESTDIQNAKLKEIYGIDSDISDHNLLNLVYDAVVDFCKINKNDRLFEGLQLTTDSFNDEAFYKTKYGNNGFKIVYDNNPDTWKNIKNELEKLYDEGKIAGTNKKYVQYVSLGDFLNYVFNPYAYNVCKERAYCDDSLKLIKRIMSNSGIDAFNREYIAARMSGIACPKKLEEYFIDNGGNATLVFPENKIEFYKGNTCNFGSIEEAKEYLRNYGIEGSFTDIRQANTVVEAVKDLIEATGNKKIFKGLKIISDPREFKDDLWTKASFCWYDKNDEQVIKLNPSYCWKVAEQKEQVDYDAGLHPTYRVKDAMIHELIHYIDYKGNPKEYSKMSYDFQHGNKAFSDTGYDYIGKVSTYALEEPAEFCAEYAVGKLAGIKYPKCTDEEFLKRFNGPKISFPKPVVNT